jgi:anti-sigma factor RsiW
MNHPRLLPDDPRLTAYAVGELAGPDRAAVEAALRRDPALRAQVEELRATAALLASARAAEAEEASAAGPALAPVVPINGQVAVAPEPDRAGSEAGDGDAWRYEPRSAARRGGRGARTRFLKLPRV